MWEGGGYTLDLQRVSLNSQNPVHVNFFLRFSIQSLFKISFLKTIRESTGGLNGFQGKENKLHWYRLIQKDATWWLYLS